MVLLISENLTKATFVAGVTAVLLLACLMQARGGEVANQPPASGASEPPADPYLWLEEVTGEKALNWVRAQNAISTRELEASSDFEPIRRRLLAILDSKEKIPYVTKHGGWCYNFWRDNQHVRGLWRQTTLAEFKKAEPAWETVLDLDQLAAAEKENWVWKGYDILYPSYDRCLVFLSRGGADASVVREFDLKSKKFVAGGFYLPEAKAAVAWRNRNTLYVGTDFGPGSLTASGYPRVIKEWKRHTPLAQAKLVFEGKPEDVSVDPAVAHDHGRTYEFIHRGVTFFTSEDFVRRRGGAPNSVSARGEEATSRRNGVRRSDADQWVKIDKPADAIVDTFEDQLLLRLRSDWSVGGKTYPGGSLLAAGFDDYLKGKRELSALFTPTERKCLAGTSDTKHYLLVNELDNVHNRLYVLQHRKGQWTRTPLAAPAFGSVGISGVDPYDSDDYFLTAADFLTPSSLYLGTLGRGARANTAPGVRPSSGAATQATEQAQGKINPLGRRTDVAAPEDGRTPGTASDRALDWAGLEKLKSLPAFFKADGLEITQHEAVSEGRHPCALFPGQPAGPAARRKEPDVALRLRRIRDSHVAQLQRRRRLGVAGARRGLCAGQHPGRRRVRPQVARSRPQAASPTRLR